MTDVQGFLVDLTLDGTVITARLQDLSLDRTRNVMAKATMKGDGKPTQLAGQETGTLSMNGQVDTAGQAGLETTWEKTDSVAFSLEIGDGATIDAGTYTGQVLLGSFNVSTAADGMVDFALSGDTYGAVTYTPPTP